MALDEAPPFWWKNPGWQSWLLAPVSYIYGKAAAQRMSSTSSHKVPVPVICVGNFVVGGAGKTPTVQLLSKHIRSLGIKPGVLTRGHGGAITAATVVRRDLHNSHDVGDEALLHAAHAVTVVSTDRTKGADLLVERGCDLILMDDGFQNPSLAKDFNLVVVDAKRGLGNGFSVPAGPLRVPLRQQLLHADAILVIGDGVRSDKVIRRCAKAGKPVFKAYAKPIGSGKLNGRPVVAFAGIADPTKFFDTVELAGAKIADRQSFGDHHPFTEEECTKLLRMAQKNKARLVTTAKDAARLRGMGDARERLLEEAEVLNMILVPEDPAMLKRISDKALTRFTGRKLNKAFRVQSDQRQHVT